MRPRGAGFRRRTGRHRGVRRGSRGQWRGWGRARRRVPEAAPPSFPPSLPPAVPGDPAGAGLSLPGALRRRMNCFANGCGDAFPRGVVDSLSPRTVFWKHCCRSWKEEAASGRAPPLRTPRAGGAACLGPSGAERGSKQRSARRPGHPLVSVCRGTPFSHRVAAPRAGLLLQPAVSPCAPLSPRSCPDCRTPRLGHGPPLFPVNP